MKDFLNLGFKFREFCIHFFVEKKVRGIEDLKEFFQFFDRCYQNHKLWDEKKLKISFSEIVKDGEINIFDVLRVFSYFSQKVADFMCSKFAIFHAGAVSDKKHTIIFVGESKTGKSTLVKIMCEAGFDFITEDTLFLGRKKIIPFPKPISMRNDAGVISEIVIPQKISHNPPRNLIFFFLKSKISSHEKYKNLLDFADLIIRLSRHNDFPFNLHQNFSDRFNKIKIENLGKGEGIISAVSMIYNFVNMRDKVWVLNKLSRSIFFSVQI